MEKDFKELTQLLKIDSNNDLFSFENGKIKPYKSRLDFQYHLTNLYDLVLSGVSNTANPVKDLIIDTYYRLVVFINQNCHNILKLH